jgi:hypothetical protein
LSGHFIQQKEHSMTSESESDAAPRTHRLRRAGIVGAAATALVLGAGAVAWADAGTANAAGPGYGNASTPPAGTSRPAQPKHIPTMDGDVTSVSGSTILIKDFDGFTRTIVTSSKTVYSDGLTASPAVGAHLHAEGTVDADGTSLDATSIAKGRTGGPGGPGRGGPGGHPGDRHAPPPAGAKPPAKGTAPKAAPSPSGSATS